MRKDDTKDSSQGLWAQHLGMADDDFDLDAILDSTLDEEFATPTTTAGVADDDCDLDLDAMLDEAIVSVAPDPADGEVAQQKRQGTDTVKSSGGSGSRYGQKGCPCVLRVSGSSGSNLPSSQQSMYI